MVGRACLQAGAARLELAPALGGGIARLDVADRPVLRPCIGAVEDPFALACNVLVPFSNRISGGGFTWNGQFHAVPPNLAAEALPLHGDGFQKAWSLTQSRTEARLTLTDGRIGPWRYRAQQRLALTETRLTHVLEATNTGAIPLPFGGGFHPWFPRSGATRLRFAAQTVWTEDAAYLPVEEHRLSEHAAWDFSAPRPLPEGWINNGFCGWDRMARIDQGDDAVSCTVRSSAALDVALVYFPGAEADFFCFEPVSHPVDAFHLPGAPGLEALAPGATWTVSMEIAWAS